MFGSDSAESLWSRQPGIGDLRQMAWCCKAESGGWTERRRERKRREEENEMEERSGRVATRVILSDRCRFVVFMANGGKYFSTFTQVVDCCI